MINTASRRSFLRTAPIAAATAGLALADTSVFAAAQAAPQSAPATGFQVFTAQQLADDAKALQAKPGSNNLADFKTASVTLTTEVAKAGAEFEWHQGTDHIVQIVDGTTVYELGGTPKDGHSNNNRAGEFLAPEAEGATKLTLRKGDMITIPRGTLHKRTTAESVTFYLISVKGMVM